MGLCSTAVAELNPGIFQIRGLGGSSHSYVIKGDYMNVMIDSGSDQNFPVLERGLRHIGIKVRDVNLVINSHEHWDHIGANRYLEPRRRLCFPKEVRVRDDCRLSSRRIQDNHGRLLRDHVQG